ncbi:c-type cytochrome [Flectobacillus rivi]|uniref:Cytochrome c n=1 Tax=Flectobacillus rivi TaxID=2984209 RepID=A0ABT6Z691_9BACT|nr:cytochrome c [Flectobacillus rivi]MDI9876648.1 cytochrome c [Flectobacillus rivi]
MKWTYVVESLIVGLILLGMGACTNKKDDILNPNDCSGIEVKFSTNINPIIQSSCAFNSGCHGVGSVNGPGAFTDYAKISASANAIKDAVVSKRMPLGATLSDADIQKIKCWVSSGALNN